MKKAFTLMEVNLAILVMAGGILSIVGLYSLGFRENRQSAEDVASAAYADAVLSPLVMAMSSTNVTWQQFRNMKSYPDDTGWKAYFNNDGIVASDPDSKAQGSYGHVRSALGDKDNVLSWPTTASAGLKAGVVIMHREGSAVARLAFRATKIPAMLLSAPIYYTEVRFQGPTQHVGGGGGQ